MGGINSKLEDDVLAAFERACREQQWDVAEHLLHALEAMALCEGHERLIERAFLYVAHTVPPCRQTQSTVSGSVKEWMQNNPARPKLRNR